jgi:hypothetical protein
MTVYEKRGKLVLSPGIEYPELVLYEFAKDYRVDMVFCERHPSEGCVDCNSIFLCDLKKTEGNL